MVHTHCQESHVPHTYLACRQGTGCTTALHACITTTARTQQTQLNFANHAPSN